MSDETKNTQQEQVQAKDPSQSFNELRAKAKAQEEELERLKQQNMLIMQQMQQPKQSDTSSEPEFDLEQLDDEEWANVSHLKKARKKDQKKLQELENRAILLDLRDEYDDFKKVCTQENANALEKADPVLAQSILLNPSYENKMRLMYNSIKRYGIYKEEQPPKEEAVLAEYNTSKPKPSSVSRGTQNQNALSSAATWNGVLSDEQKLQHYRRAQKIARGEPVQ